MIALLSKNSLFRYLLIFIFLAGFSSPTMASEGSDGEEKFDVSAVIMHHVLDDHIWHFFDGHYGTLYLPVIVYSEERGFEMFSSSNFYDEHHNIIEYNGYRLEHNHIYLGEQQVLDLSITKNVAMLFLTAFLVFLVMRSVAKGYERNRGRAPKGIQSFMEPVILFVTDEVIKPNAGPKADRYVPYLLTLFFFILFGNILGLLPGAANMTGNIAVTMVLAIFTFLITNLSGNKGYWGHIFWTPGVPLPLRLIILPVEIIGVFTKPFALMIRLFAAITAGHIVVLSLLCMAFIFHSYAVGIGASIFVTLINLIELLVAGIQAYVFTLFSSLYIGMATEEHEHH